MFYCHPYLGKIPILTSIFLQVGWFNRQTSLGFLTGRVIAPVSPKMVYLGMLEKAKQIPGLPGWQLHHQVVSIT